MAQKKAPQVTDTPTEPSPLHKKVEQQDMALKQLNSQLIHLKAQGFDVMNENQQMRQLLDTIGQKLGVTNSEEMMSKLDELINA